MRKYVSDCISDGMTYKITASKASKEFGMHVTSDKVRAQKRQGFLGIDKNKPIERQQQPSGGGGEKEEFTEDGNHAILEKRSFTNPYLQDGGSLSNPRTLNELLEACGVDTTIWKVDKYVVNKWEVSMNTVEGIINRPLFQVKAWLIRKEPIKHDFPVVAAIQASSKVLAHASKSYSKKNMHQALVIPDSQNGYSRDINTGKLDPFHDRRAWDLCVQVAKRERPDVIVLLGDMLDLPDWSDKFLRSPEFYFTTQPALNELHWWISQLARTGAEMYYIEGNHERRMAKAVITNLISAYNIKPANQPDIPASMSVPNLLGLKDLGVSYRGPYPKGEYWINDNLKCVHGTIARRGNSDTVKAILKDARHSQIVGHVHRKEYAVKTVHPRRGAVSYVAYSPGTIARIDGAVPAATDKVDWQQGFGVVDFEVGNGMFNIHPYNITDGKTVYNGRRMEARADINEVVCEAMGWA